MVSTAALRRTHFERRASVQAGSVIEAADALSVLADGLAHSAVSIGEARQRGKVVFVFPGQGSQWRAMGRAMLRDSEVFAEVAQQCDAALRSLTGWSVLSVLRDDEDAASFERVDVVQPALFVMSVALAAVWRSLGLEPAAVVGHSQGEAGAAVVSGALSLEDGARVVAVRSRLLSRLSGTGGMAVLGLSAEQAQALIAPWGEALSVAVVNASNSTVVSGAASAIDELVALQESDEAETVFCRKVNVDYASHSAQVQEVLGELKEQLASIRPRSGNLPFYSAMTGAQLLPVVPNRVNPLKRITGRRIREATPGIGMVRSVSVCVEAWSWSYAAVVVV